MVTYFVTKMITTCSPMIRQFFDTMIVASSVVITIRKNVSAGNCFEAPQITFRGQVFRKPVNANPEFKANRSINFSCIKMFSTAYV